MKVIFIGICYNIVTKTGRHNDEEIRYHTAYKAEKRRLQTE